MLEPTFPVTFQLYCSSESSWKVLRGSLLVTKVTARFLPSCEVNGEWSGSFIELFYSTRTLKALSVERIIVRNH